MKHHMLSQFHTSNASRMICYVPISILNSLPVRRTSFLALAMLMLVHQTCFAAYRGAVESATPQSPVEIGHDLLVTLVVRNTGTTSWSNQGLPTWIAMAGDTEFESYYGVSSGSVASGVMRIPASLLPTNQGTYSIQINVLNQGASGPTGYYTAMSGSPVLVTYSTTNAPPVATTQTTVGAPNNDLLIQLAGTDLNGLPDDQLTFRITALPVLGSLYQYTGGGRGDLIIAANTPVSDPVGRVVFRPAPDGYGPQYASFQFVANDGTYDSSSATVVIDVAAKANVWTQPAAFPTGTNVLLNGTTTPYLPSTAWFEWGATTSYGNRTGLLSLGGGASVVRLTNALSGVSPYQTYHYRLVVSNSVGLVPGGDQVFAFGDRVQRWGFGATNVPFGLGNVVAIAAGRTVCLALKKGGGVVAWGGSNAKPDVAAGLRNVVAIAAGDDHCLALNNDGTVAAWGGSYAKPDVAAGLRNVVAIAAGMGHSLALESDGTVAAWGYNNNGETDVPAGLRDVVAIAAGSWHSLALKSDHTVVAWGSNFSGQTNVPSGLNDVVAIAGGVSHSLALKSDGTVVAWGANTYGQTNAPTGLSNVVAIASRGNHNLALRSDGTVVAWGYNENGQTNVPLGLSNVVAIAGNFEYSLALAGNDPPTATPQIVVGALNRDSVITLSGRDVNLEPELLTLKITTLSLDGTLYQNNAGGRGSPVMAGDMVTDPSGRVIFTPASNAFGVPYASFQFVANDGMYDSPPATVVINVHGAPFVITQPATLITDSGAVLNGTVTPNFPSVAWFEWGATISYGNQTEPLSLGDGVSVVRLTNALNGLLPYQTYHYRLVASNSAGLVHGNPRVFAFGKRVMAWGNNQFGQTNVAPNMSNIVAVSAGGYHNLALRSDGTVIAWGYNYDGQTIVPPNLSNVVAIAAGGAHSLALKGNGTIMAWGQNRMGQANVPLDLGSAVAIAAGSSHSLALKSDGTVVAWGYNSDGQTKVPLGMSNVVAIAAGGAHSLALRGNGTVVAWGQNGYGQTNVPVGLESAVAIAAGGSSLALKSDGTVIAWGVYNSNGQTNVLSGLDDVVAIAVDLALRGNGTVVPWGGNSAGQTNVPVGLSNVVAIACGLSHTLALTADSLLATVPSVITQPATQITATEAVLNGALKPNSLSASAWFQWGTTTNYGATTAITNLGSGNDTVAITAKVQGLLPLMMYLLPPGGVQQRWHDSGQ